ncbi:hypothetical protein CupriaWKF_27970 [Cupriavidus sp. WKF15]|uniref:hypothetical protein n=1 Tax=Cupriavidus sp. WKF15 TaxID=3032282 RepID=UPI0023E2DC52|nr:hypothetical protein [Cupriavidus sp. WKF15]WER48611.1 hypothetical protein CupriaWKF_27970 [Cupriavidus sp. WKF15]
MEVTIVWDSTDPEPGPRRGSLRADQITSFVDVSARRDALGSQVHLVLAQPHDYVNEEDDAGGVVRAQRELYVLESYDMIREELRAAK